MLRQATVPLAVLLLLLATGVATSTPALQVYGAGEKSCADWNTAQQAGNEDARVMQSWILGYISGGVMVYAQQPNAVPLRPMGVEEVPRRLEGERLSEPMVRTLSWEAPDLMALASQQCTSIPDQSLSTVAAKIVNHLTRQGPPLSK
jgi:hypothetical protein